MIEEDSPELIAAMRELCRRFAERVPSVYEEAARLFGLVSTHSSASACKEELQDLLREVHSLVGTGAQFGFPELADIASDCEQQVAALQRASDQDWSAALALTSEKLDALLAFKVEAPKE